MSGKIYMVAYGAPGSANRKWYSGISTSAKKVKFSDGDVWPKVGYKLTGDVTLDQFIMQEAQDPTKSPSILGPFTEEEMVNRAAMTLMDISGGDIQEESKSPSVGEEAYASLEMEGGGRKRRKSSKHSKLKRKKSSKHRKTKKRKSNRRKSRRRRSRGRI
jgi:hypothetical protein